MHRPKADSGDCQEPQEPAEQTLADRRSITVGRRALHDVSRPRSSAFFACRRVASGDVLAGPQMVGGRRAPRRALCQSACDPGHGGDREWLGGH